MEKHATETLVHEHIDVQKGNVSVKAQIITSLIKLMFAKGVPANTDNHQPD